MTQQTSKPVCIVTGGSFGIGQAICDKFNRQHHQVINLDIAHNPQQSKEIQWFKCDMKSSASVKQLIEQVIVRYGRVDTLISNAGIHLSATIEETTEAQFDELFALNVKGAISATKAVLPTMKVQNNGVILYMASEQALVAKTNSFAYNMSKAALASMAKTTALDYAKYQIRANAICQGTIETPLYHQAIDKYVASSGADKNQVHAEEAALQPIGRLGQADEVAALAYFLASDDAKFITGSLQVIDGGYTTQ
ncbi:SDR family oxidoreductase [Paraglaciecola aquimarina]|uniref:SDR family oxidoreductase n=1 Tax=Paraglaciecola aquimarina TaxID=1235557 RepID=A0ABU3SX32_9ALTE|nr:SDR family oxidoreductase [Paraglaciecola aquimarina]MDU0354543.1 SDR family oxidoreductase [Paraglaciecola aquimarina]